jgi:hypothetical protein
MGRLSVIHGGAERRRSAPPGSILAGVEAGFEFEKMWEVIAEQPQTHGNNRASNAVLSQGQRPMKRDPPAERWLLPLAATAIVLIAAAGCEEKIYEVELRPRGDKIERRLTLTRRDRRDHSKKNLAQDDQAELGRIARAYQTEPPSLPRAKASFAGTFGGVLPRDVGGDGHYVHWESPLGRVSIYVERFRGNDDIYSSLEARRQAVDSLVDLLVAWFEAELRTEPGWPPLRAFLDKQFRTDLQNLSLLVWSTNVREVYESTDALAEVAFRAAQYCVERKYASYEETPALLREFGDASRRKNATALFARIRRLLVLHANGASDSHPTLSLGFLADSQTAYASWQRYFVHTPYFQQHKADVAAEVGQQLGPAAAAAAKELQQGKGGTGQGGTEKGSTLKPKAGDLSRWEQATAEAELGHLFLQAFPITYHLLSDASRVRLRLQAPRKPFWSNGSWNAKESRVEWSPLIAELPKPGREQRWDWPTLCFAAWDEPHEEGQKPVFGGVALTGGELLKYCLWYQGLSGLEQKEWDAFMATIKKDDPASHVKAFRFSNERGEDQSNPSAATEGATIIAGVLYPESRHTNKTEARPAPEAANPSGDGH